ncbi:MAG: SPOR domain-containing protein [Ignavibacteriales bacterium]|nr:SPOR domain-containing protein [Ignavibacteriales bacterium]
MSILVFTRTSAQTATDLSVRPATSRLEIKEGGVVSVGFIVTNTSLRERTVSATLVLPTGWRTVLREGTYNVKARSEDVRLVSFSFSPETEAGTYEVSYRATDPLVPGTTPEAAVSVVILPSRRLDVRLVDIPRYVGGGEVFITVFDVVNAGNVGGKVALTVKTSQGFPAILDSSTVTLGPRQRRPVRARVRTSSSLQGKTSTAVELHAVFTSDSTVQARMSGVTDVIPKTSEMKDEYHSYPLVVTGRTAGEDERLGGQVEISGIGALSEGGSDKLEVFLRTTDIQSQSSLGLRDEYRFRYTSPAGELRFGDWTYSLSPLTELSRYAFGGSGKASIGNATAGGFYNETRFYRPSQRQAGGFLRYEPVKGYSLGVQHLERREHVQAGVSSLRALLAPVQAALVDLEYGVSNAGGIQDKAFAGQFSARVPWGAFDARVVNAGGRYQGYYRDLSFGSLTLQTQPMRNVQTEAYFRSERRNRNNDTTQLFVPFEQVFQIGARYSNLIGLSYRKTLQEDLRKNPQYKRSEEIGRLRLGCALSFVDLFTDLDVGVTRNVLQGGTFPFRRYALFAALSPFASQTYTLSLDYAKDRNLYTSEHQERLSFGVGASVLLAQRTSLQGNVYWSHLEAVTRQEFTLLDFILRHEFSNRHQLSLRARKNYFVPGVRTADLAYVLEYRVPLAVPLHRSGSSSRLRGLVLGEDNKPVSNALVNVGNAAAITDSKGEFSVALPPGRHYLVLDKASVGLDRVTMQPMPMELDVREGREERTILNVVRGATIKADVSMKTFIESTDSLLDAGARSGILIEASNGLELRRRVSDSRGRVEFTELIPGKWTLRIVGGNIPSFHVLAPEKTDVSVAPGDQAVVSFSIVPRKRTIRIIQTEEPPVVHAEPDRREPSEPCLITYDPRLNGYMLQVSSWGTRSKAAERVRVAEQATGKKATVERATVPGVGVRYRVKVGLFSSATEAELACRVLQRLEMEPAHD